MNIFCDFHHASLLKSFILLFEKRMDGNVYRPIGMEWAEKGYWKVYDHPETQAQFLGIGAATPDGTPPLNEVVASTSQHHPETHEFETIIYRCQDIEGDKWESNKAITFSGFMQTPIDIVIASIPQHIEPFKRLCELHPSHPKLIYQIGNQWNVGENEVKNIMASANIDIPANINSVIYHQEFDTTVFRPNPPRVQTDLIYSFVNVFNGQSHFADDWQLFERMEKLMDGWIFKSYGGQCRDGSMNGSKELADKMNEAKFIWHTKAYGDGYGHVLHNAAACGKPVITRLSDYTGKLGEKLLIDGKTCIAIDGLNPQEIMNKINFYNDSWRYADMCTQVFQNFQTVCNFDKEFEYIKIFLDNLQ